MSLDLRKIKTIEDSIKCFAAETRKDYRHADQINKLSIPRKEEKSDGTFKKIGVRPQMGLDFFDPDSNVAPIIISLGANVATGEKNYFVKNLLQEYSEDNVNSVSIRNLDATSIINFIGEIGHRERIVILSSVEFVYKTLFNRRIINHASWDNQKNCYTLGGVPLYTLAKKFIGIKDYVIVLDKESVIWRYVPDEEDNKLHIEIYPKEDSYDIQVYTLVKQEVNLSRVRIINITGQTD